MVVRGGRATEPAGDARAVALMPCVFMRVMHDMHACGRLEPGVAYGVCAAHSAAQSLAVPKGEMLGKIRPMHGRVGTGPWHSCPVYRQTRWPSAVVHRCRLHASVSGGLSTPVTR